MSPANSNDGGYSLDSEQSQNPIRWLFIEKPMTDNIVNPSKLNNQTLIQQIDVMSSIASAFSDFAKMPTQKREKIEVISVVKLALDIFDEDFINYKPKEKELHANLDKTQLIRIVTNLVKNAMQASENEENPIIDVVVL